MQNEAKIIAEAKEEAARIIARANAEIELEKKLSKGTHECKIKVGYAEEGNVSSAFPLTIEVR